MAINPVPRQSVTKQVAGPSLSLTIDGASGWLQPIPGNLLVCVGAFRVDAVTTNAPTLPADFVPVQSHYTGSGASRGVFSWKQAVGSETSLTLTGHAFDIGFHSMAFLLMEFDATDLDLTTGVLASVEAGPTNTTSLATGTANSSGDKSLAISWLVPNNFNAWGNGATGPSIGSGYSDRTGHPFSNGQICAYVASKAVTGVADQAATWSTTDVGGSAYAGTAVFAGEPLVRTLTLDDSTAAPGQTIATTVSTAFAGAIDTLEWPSGDDLAAAVSPAATTATASFLIPSVDAAFVAAGELAHTMFDTAYSVTVNDGATASETVSLTIPLPAGYFLVTADTAFAGLSANAQLWASSSTIVGDKYLISGANVLAVSDDLEIQFATGAATFRHVRWDSAAGTPTWGAAGTYTGFNAATAQTISLGATAYNVGTNATYTISSPDAIPDAGTLNGVNIDRTGATNTGDTFAVPTLEAFLTGAHNATPWFEEIDLVIGFAARDDLTAQLVIIGPSNANIENATYWTGVAPPAPSGVFGGTSEGNSYIFEVANGAVNAISADGALSTSTSYCRIKRWHYTLGAWVALSDYVSTNAYRAEFANRSIDAKLSGYFVRGSSANDISVAGVLSTVATSVPAFNGNSGLVLEAARTNLALYSETFSNAAWVAVSVTKGTTSISTPDGDTVTTGRLTSTGANGTLLQTVTSASAGRAFSLWMRRVTGTGSIQMTVNNGTAWTTKTLTSSWQRFDIYLAAVTNPVFGVRIVTSGDAIEVFGAQLESAEFPTSYIPTAGTSVPRSAAYILPVPLNEMGAVKKTNGYSVHTAIKMPFASTLGQSGLPIIAELYGDATNRVRIYFSATTGRITCERLANNVSTLTHADTTWAVGDVLNIRAAWAESGSILCVNAVTATSVTGTSLSVVAAQLSVNARNDAGLVGNGIYSGIKLWDYALTQSELQALSASDFSYVAPVRAIKRPERAIARPLINSIVR